MFRKLSVVLIVALCLVSVPAFHTSAANITTPIQHVSQSTPTTCQNTDFLTGIGKDMNDLGTTFSGTDMKAIGSTVQSFLSIAVTRQKYENMTTTSDCVDLQLETIIAFSNAGDILALNLAALSDTANASAYTGVMPAQLTRFQNSIQNVLILAGVATPAAGSTPVGRTSQITSTTCSDSTFLSGLGSDFTAFSQTFSATDMTKITPIAQAILSVSALRQKYEDMSAPSGCEITQLTAIIAFANATDLLGLSLAVVADPVNAATYTKVMAPQASRTQQWIQNVLVAAGVATPSASSMVTPVATAAQ